VLKSLAAVLCLSFIVSAHAKIGETVPQLINRFGKSYTVEPEERGERYKFRSANVSVDAVVANGVSVGEVYFSDHPLNSKGEPPNDMVQAILRTNVPRARWHEIRTGWGDYELQSDDRDYIAVLIYSGPQAENAIWTMVVTRSDALFYAIPVVPSSPSPPAAASTTHTTSPSIQPTPRRPFDATIDWDSKNSATPVATASVSAPRARAPAGSGAARDSC